MKLLHGSYTNIVQPDLTLCRSRNDFGKGFYLTPDWQRAYKLGKRSADLKGLSPVVNTFLFYESRAVKSGCKIKKFKGFTLEWGRFILENRDNEHYNHPYDIVIGPVADEVVQRKVEEHKQTYGEDYMSDEAVRNFINEVSQFTVKYIQYCFCTELSLEQLIKE